MKSANTRVVPGDDFNEMFPAKRRVESTRAVLGFIVGVVFLLVFASGPFIL